MRIRTVKPEFWKSDDIASLPLSARLTFIGLWNYVDDNGVGDGRIKSIASDLYLNDLLCDQHATFMRVACDLHALIMRELITFFVHNNKVYVAINTWSKHQYIPRPTKGHQYPSPPAQTASVENPVENMVKILACDPHAIHMQKTCMEKEREREKELKETPLTGGKESSSAASLVQAGPQAAPAERMNQKARPQQGCRIPKNWQPDEAMKAWTQNEIGNRPINPGRILDDFRDYWEAKTGQNATKKNWDATWRRWVRKVVTDHDSGYKSQSQIMRENMARAVQMDQQLAVNEFLETAK